MKKKKNIFGIICGFAIGTIISSLTATYAATTLSSKNVYYDNTNSGGSSSNVAGAIDELYATANDQDILMNKMLDKIYPVGSVYISTTDSSVDTVVTRFGGTWEKFGEGKTLVGEGTNTDSENNSKTFTISENTAKTGVYKTKLSAANLPYHTHDITHTHTTPSTTISKSGAHVHDEKHTFSSGTATQSGWANQIVLNGKGGIGSWSYATANGEHTHTVPSLTTNSQSTKTSGGAGYDSTNITAVNVQNPYIVVYMYKRIG